MSQLIRYRNKVVSFMKKAPVKMTLFIGLIVLARASFADDPLAGAEPVVKDAYNGTLKTYLYVGEAIAAIMTLIFTRNIKALGGVGAIAIFLNVVAALAGI
ncbi:TPA: fimbrial protein [Legionella pneumophila]|nr:fimbrial protein [Legionella pneumophila]HBD7410325.1 fimbrial protein [Legionella pneumophila]HBD9405518.1 fimbrial protein [Legionella pneumophila]HBI2968747.1 fimbrial protein [Legionella pneumophila]